jgi:aspartate-semialdehyde dehydrogenase
VPVINGHSESVFIKVRNEASRLSIIKLLEGKEGIKVIDDPLKEAFPTALENANKTSDVYVGRIRSSKINNEDWISCWIVADNVFGKGAALNAVQILELMKKADEN